MRTYQFQALNAQGQKIRGAIPASSRAQALQRLKQKRLQPIYLQPQKFSWLSNNHSGTWTIEWAKDVGFFLKQGLGLIESLSASKLRLNSSQKQLVDLITEGLYVGMPLSQILLEYGIFPKLFLGLLQVAEATGQYAQSFEDYALLREEEQQFFKQLRTSLQYPLILVVVILAMVVGFSEFLLPTAMEFFKQNNFEQQLATKLFIQFADGLKGLLSIFTNWQFLLMAFMSMYVLSKFPKFKYYLSWLTIKLPFFGTIYLQTLQALYLKSFATLLARGHHVLLAANYSGEILQNIYLKQQATYIDYAIQQTGKISGAIANFLRLPVPLANLLRTGEKTAQLGVYSDICAAALKNQSRQRLQIILAWTGPFLVSTMGIVMIWMVVAIVVPLYDQITRMD
jgi:type II secretory pathway component PulF